MPPSPPPSPASGWRGYLTILGPGIAIAATGVGAGDMVTAAVSGAKFGYTVVWAAVVGALLKFVLNEGLARWQLATGTTLLEGWVQRLGRWAQWYFLVYLVFWSFVIGGALSSACGLAAHAIAPVLSVKAWAIAHSLAAAAIVLIGGYQQFERLMKVFIGFMFVALIGCACCAVPPVAAVKQAIVQTSLPDGSAKCVLGVIGGVGGTLTLMAYGYWMRERRWEGAGWARAVRFDLGVAYALTGVFGIAVMVLASEVLHTRGVTIEGKGGVLKMANMLGDVIGPIGDWTFRFGFWAAVTTSMLGVWQGVPYLFCDFLGLMKRLPDDQRNAQLSHRSVWYRSYLVWLAIPPLALLHFDKPVGLIVIYSVVGALFMPFLAATLLYMNSRRDWVGDRLRNGWLTNALLILSLVLFGYLSVQGIAGAFEKLTALMGK